MYVLSECGLGWLLSSSKVLKPLEPDPEALLDFLGISAQVKSSLSSLGFERSRN